MAAGATTGDQRVIGPSDGIVVTVEDRDHSVHAIDRLGKLKATRA
jgi:hypothetical protein